MKLTTDTKFSDSLTGNFTNVVLKLGKLKIDDQSQVQFLADFCLN